MLPQLLESGRLPKEVVWELLEEVTAGTFLWNSEEDSVRWSRKLFVALGYEDGAQAGYSDIEALIHPDDQQPMAEAVARSQAEKTNYEIRLRLRAADGDYRSFSVSGIWYKDPETDMSHLFGFMKDETELNAVREREQKTQRLFEQFFNKAPLAVYIKNREYRHLYGNDKAAELCGCSLEELLQKPTPDLFGKASAAALQEADARVLDHHETVVWSGEVRTRSGEDRYIVDTKFPIIDPITGETLLGGFGLDITRERDMEVSLAQVRKMEALGQLVDGVVHDFNNTLAVLRGNIDLVQLEQPEMEASPYVSDMSVAIERGAGLIAQLLAFGRKSVLVPKSENLNRIITEADRLFRRTLPESINIETVCGGGLWNTVIDANQVENALLSLALNARDAMPQGGTITLETSNVRLDGNYIGDRLEELEPGRYVMLAVTDTGEGMSESIQKRAFEPYYSTKGTAAGGGMGLSTAFGLMKQIGGTARIYSELGIGTTVKLYFPASSGVDEASVRSIEGPVSEGFGRVLVAEDEELLRRTLVRQLTSIGYDVTEAESGDAALKIIEGGDEFEVLITDIVMPGKLQGPQLAHAVRESRPNLPVIFISGYPNEAAVHGNGLRPSDEILTKPVPFRDLAAAVEKAIASASRRL